jgi:glycyl-tRNA synthetase beta chain
MKTLLLEIGAEEIPAGYIQPALQALSENLVKKLSAHRITCGTTRTFGTPRRLAVEISDVSEKQDSITSKVMGPPVKVGFDENGQPTVAAQKFAEKVGLPVSRLTTQETPKGSYLCAKVTERGVTTKTILKKVLPQAILSVPFPKTMRWSNMSLAFARPIISILALLGEQIIPFQLERLKSGRWTYGHSTMAPKKLKLKSSLEYIETLRSAQVIADFEERKQLVSKGIADATKEAGGNILEDPELLDIVTNLVEYPVAAAGSFDKSFLELPREILITSMREHQKYFAVTDRQENLMPFFVAVNNTRPKDLSLVKKGHERVLRARLEDARFFYRSDLTDSMDTWREKLQRVLFQAKLGSVYDKVERIIKLTDFLCNYLSVENETTAQALKAATYCKADLVSQVVGEFPKLQGIMGRVYAQAAGMPTDVATAIEEHYRPLYSGGKLPETLIGAMVAMADKIDSICGCFCVGLIPTGAADPYALRRQSIGILQIILSQDLAIPLGSLIDASVALFSEKQNMSSKNISEEVLTFFKNRMAHLLSEDGFSKDVIASVLSTPVNQIPHVWAKVAALEALKNRPDFEPLASAFKRVVNIIKKADPLEGQKVEENLFETPSEASLYTTYQKVKQTVLEALDRGQFEKALLAVASLRKDVDEFFDAVLVMAEDKRIRENRLGLLRCIADLFSKLADFSKIST